MATKEISVRPAPEPDKTPKEGEEQHILKYMQTTETEPKERESVDGTEQQILKNKAFVVYYDRNVDVKKRTSGLIRVILPRGTDTIHL